MRKKGPRVRAVVGYGRRVLAVPSIGGLAVSRLTIAGVDTLLPLPYAADQSLNGHVVRNLEDE